MGDVNIAEESEGKESECGSTVGLKRRNCQLLIALKCFRLSPTFYSPSLADKTTSNRTRLNFFLKGRERERKKKKKNYLSSRFCFGAMPLMMIIEERPSRH